MAMAVKRIIGLIIALVFCANVSTALYEDQVGVADWYVTLFSILHFIFSDNLS